MDWPRSAIIQFFVLAVLTLTHHQAEGKIVAVNGIQFESKNHFSFESGFVSCSPNPCENGARCIKNSLGSARCE